MTRNQIDYWNMMRQSRADQEQARSNRAQESLAAQRNWETQRANFAQEAIARQNALTNSRAQSETARSNLSRESETKRSNIAQEGLTANAQTLTRLQTQETARSNRANENVRLISAMSDVKKASTQATQASNSYALGVESNRIARQNVLNSREYNMAMANVQRSRAREEARSNLVSERIRARETEIKESNYNLGLQTLQEQIRHNQTQEYLQAFSSAVNTGLSMTLLGGKKR